MASARVYRHAVRGPDCGAHRMRRDGYSRRSSRIYQRGDGQGGAVNRNEGLHSVWRGKWRRLVRRTKGDTKSLAMLVYSLALVCWHRWAKFNFSAS